MTSGQSTLSITDLPFWYSFINIIYIWTTGSASIEEFGSRFVTVGLISGFIGTFFVFWHPVQWILEKGFWLSRQSFKLYGISHGELSPKHYDIILHDEYLRLSLKTSTINHYKNKIVSQIYFVIILVTVFTALLDTNFQQYISLNNSSYLLPIQIVVALMIGGLCYLTWTQRKYTIENIQLHSMYYFITSQLEKFSDVSYLKESIDLHDWTTARESIYRILLKHWNVLVKFSKS